MFRKKTFIALIPALMLIGGFSAGAAFRAEPGGHARRRKLGLGPAVNRLSISLAGLLLPCLMLLLGATTAWSANYIWTNKASTAYWTNIANCWSPAGGMPDGITNTVYITNAITGNQTITLGQVITNSILWIGATNTGGSFTIQDSTYSMVFYTSSIKSKSSSP